MWTSEAGGEADEEADQHLHLQRDAPLRVRLHRAFPRCWSRRHRGAGGQKSTSSGLHGRSHADARRRRCWRSPGSNCCRPGRSSSPSSLAGLALNIVPGADMTFIIASAARGGRRDGVIASLGVGAGALVHILAAVLGLSAILASSQAAFECSNGSARPICSGWRSAAARRRRGRGDGAPPPLPAGGCSARRCWSTC